MGAADERRLEVLRAIVADFVATKAPIGSKVLVERHNLGVSSATVRNDMAVLEAEGYITQPHTSSGRVPTEKGYREFVDRIEQVKPLSSAEWRSASSNLVTPSTTTSSLSCGSCSARRWRARKSRRRPSRSATWSVSWTAPAAWVTRLAGRRRCCWS